MILRKFYLLLIALSLMLSPFVIEAKTQNKTAAKKSTISKSHTQIQTGIASYYAERFHGRKTANGEIFNMNAYTAAHKTLPLGSYALVTNLTNGRKVIVRINDRGPFVSKRILDLSKAAAKEIGSFRKGLARVQIRALNVDKKGYIHDKDAKYLATVAKKLGFRLKYKTESTKAKTKPKPTQTRTSYFIKVTTQNEKQARLLLKKLQKKGKITPLANKKYQLIFETISSVENKKLKNKIRQLGNYSVSTYSKSKQTK
ncbi:rare lipoprotein A [Nicoletella semolina]|uniref:Endolytic peptidoglycan transglycosylase RlpA n=1 Tax=Nicoletella semolina TaxID=271160 RepID=A0A4R2N853_9PAST|nr:septal ring lytic transglycosylase RlpA family protein [Nicoletella semolina]MDH2924669.1 hypothetical protein [Nicoletella semolina]TCP17035.1 rare lipoprotein A [Nicoletella semolina]